MGFGVVSDDPQDMELPMGEQPPGTGMALSAGANAPTAMDQANLVPLLERLEALSFTFEALNASSRTYAAEAVLETLGRMERRDLQALAAVEAFASALKTVGQHLAGLRNAIQGTAHDAAHGFQLITERLDQLENRMGANALTGPSDGSQLTVIADRLGAIEELIGQGEAYDPSPMVQILETMVQKVEKVEEKVEDLPGRVAEAVDMAPVASNLENIAERMASVERKIDEAKTVDVTPLRLALDVISKRVARIEQRMEQAPEQAQGVDTSSITQVLEAISSRIGNMEERVSSTDKVDALSGFLEMVNKRLERMESGLTAGKTLPPGVRVNANPRPQPPVQTAAPAPAPAKTPVVATAPAQPQAVQNPTPAPAATVAAPAAPAPKNPAPKNPALSRPIAPPPAEPQPSAASVIPPVLQGSEQAPPIAKQQVDNLLEQVLKVLSR